MRSGVVIFLLIMSIALVAWNPGTRVYATPVSYTLYGSSTDGWGFANQTMTRPGPDLTARQGETLQLTLTAVIEGSNTFAHDFYVDYNNNTQHDANEPVSNVFGGGPPDTTTFTFAVNSLPANYTYYCSFHQSTMYGKFMVTPDIAPRASFYYTPSSPSSGQPVTFNASGSSDQDGTVVSYAWLFGDGGSGSGVTVQHVYLNSGSYAVTLTVTDDGGKSGMAQQQVSVAGPGNVAPIANFTFTPQNPTLGQRVNFNASSSRDPDPGDQVASYSWNFGDGMVLSNQTQPLANHTYRTFGIMPVSLNVTDTHRALSQHTVQVDVLPIRNIAVTRLVVTPLTVKSGQQVNTEVLVENLGNVTESFQLQLGWNFTIIKIWPVTLYAGERVTEPYNWTAPRSGVYNVFARALVSVEDQNTSDNEKMIVLTVEAQGLPIILYLSIPAAVSAGALAVYLFRKRRVAAPTFS